MAKKIFILTFILFFFSIFNTAQIYANSVYTVNDVTAHNQEDNCWVIFDNKVYNITDYIKVHDKYMDIRSWCGKDMTHDFKTKAGQGEDHKQSSYNLLEEFYIGDLDHSSDTNTAEIEDTYSVEISGSEMKDLSIKEIADLWDISADIYLQELQKEFNLKKTYTTDSKLDDLRDEYKFSPSQAKDIAEKIKNQELPINYDKSQSPRYNLPVPLFLSLALYIITYTISGSKLARKSKYLSRATFNLFWNTVLFITVTVTFSFGILMLLKNKFTFINTWTFDYEYWHVEIGIIMGVIALAHFVQRFKQYKAPFKLFWKK